MKQVIITEEQIIESFTAKMDQIEAKLDRVLNEKGQVREDKPLTRHDITRIFGVSLPTVNEWCKKGILKPFRMNSRVYFRQSDIDQLIRQQRSK